MDFCVIQVATDDGFPFNHAWGFVEGRSTYSIVLWGDGLACLTVWSKAPSLADGDSAGVLADWLDENRDDALRLGVDHRGWDALTRFMRAAFGTGESASHTIL